jgi:tetratricopeptide (TPR) repeat protein
LNLSGAESENLAGRGTTSVPAYELYLQARRLMRERTLPAVEAARELLDEALALDPDYPVALAAAAELRLLLSDTLFWSFGRIPGDQAVAEARALVDRALALDPGLAEGHATAGLMHITRNDFASAEAALVRALELNPSLSEAESWRATVLFFQGRLRDALAARRRQAEIDPLNVLHLTNLAGVLQTGRGGRKPLSRRQCGGHPLRRRDRGYAA